MDSTIERKFFEQILRNLESLSFPYLKDIITTNEANSNGNGRILSIEDMQVIIRWLEDSVIRSYTVEERKVLLSVDSSLLNNEYHKYLENLGCPYTFQTSNYEDCYESIAWITDYGIQIKYEDNIDEVNKVNEANKFSKGTKELLPESVLNTTSAKIDELGALFSMERLPNESLVDFLRKVVRKVKFTCSSMAIDGLQKHQHSNDTSNNMNIVRKEFKLEDFPLGFDTKDEVANKVALVLKMLYLSDFRELQNEANDLLILAQEYTANPRLNTAQGKVGR